MIPPVELITDDGYDLQFGTNVLGHFYFNKLLLPLLVATAMKDGIPSRVIVTSSSVSTMADKSIPIDFATLKEKDGSERRKKGTIALYAQSKFANVLYAKGLASRYDKEHIISISLDPGVIINPVLCLFTGTNILPNQEISRQICRDTYPVFSGL
jgi:retinol dehydrogenase-12